LRSRRSQPFAALEKAYEKALEYTERRFDVYSTSRVFHSRSISSALRCSMVL
jgi:hypothetical protein